MPGVDILHRENLGMSDVIADSIKKSIRRYGATCFGVEEHPLSDGDFSIKFYQPTKYDELTNDIIVRVRLHSFEERRENLNDNIAAEFARYIAEDLAKFFPSREIAVGVELMLALVMWGIASTTD